MQCVFLAKTNTFLMPRKKSNFLLFAVVKISIRWNWVHRCYANLWHIANIHRYKKIHESKQPVYQVEKAFINLIRWGSLDEFKIKPQSLLSSFSYVAGMSLSVKTNSFPNRIEWPWSVYCARGNIFRELALCVGRMQGWLPSHWVCKIEPYKLLNCGQNLPN